MGVTRGKQERILKNEKNQGSWKGAHLEDPPSKCLPKINPPAAFCCSKTGRGNTDSVESMNSAKSMQKFLNKVKISNQSKKNSWKILNFSINVCKKSPKFPLRCSEGAREKLPAWLATGKNNPDNVPKDDLTDNPLNRSTDSLAHRFFCCSKKNGGQDSPAQQNFETSSGFYTKKRGAKNFRHQSGVSPRIRCCRPGRQQSRIIKRICNTDSSTN